MRFEKVHYLVVVMPVAVLRGNNEHRAENYGESRSRIIEDNQKKPARNGKKDKPRRVPRQSVKHKRDHTYDKNVSGLCGKAFYFVFYSQKLFSHVYTRRRFLADRREALRKLYYKVIVFRLNPAGFTPPDFFATKYYYNRAKLFYYILI